MVFKEVYDNKKLLLKIVPVCVCVQLVGGEGLVSAVHEDGFRRHLLCNAV